MNNIAIEVQPSQLFTCNLKLNLIKTNKSHLKLKYNETITYNYFVQHTSLSVFQQLRITMGVRALQWKSVLFTSSCNSLPVQGCPSNTGGKSFHNGDCCLSVWFCGFYLFVFPLTCRTTSRPLQKSHDVDADVYSLHWTSSLFTTHTWYLQCIKK